MSERNTYKKTDMRFTKWEYAIHKKFFDPNTYGGALRGLLFWLFAWYVMWNIHDICISIFGDPGGTPITPADKSWVRFWAEIIGGGGTLLSIVEIITLPINRYRAKRQKQKTDAQKTASEE